MRYAGKFAGLLMAISIFFLAMSPAHAAGHLKICNKGSDNVSVAVIDWYGLMGENPTISGWYSLDVGECYRKDGLGVDVSLAFEAGSSQRSDYFYFDAPGLSGYSNDPYLVVGKVETTTRVACVDFNNPFSRQTTPDQFNVCPVGWSRIPLNWHVTTCGGLQDCSIDLEISPTISSRRPLTEKPPDPALEQNATVVPKEPSASQPPSAPIALAASVFFPSTYNDFIELCPSGPPYTGACEAANSEFRSRSYGVLRCAYYNQTINNTANYFFWSRNVPANMVALAKVTPRAGIKALGDVAVPECPKTQDEADALHPMRRR